jgi:hypothetical protein
VTPKTPNAARTEGLTPLDRERAGSVADEGGASAAVVETQKPPAPAPGPDQRGTDDDETLPFPRGQAGERARQP